MSNRIYIDDVRAAGFCVRGGRRWFAQHGLDFKKFLDEGIDEETFLESGDSLAQVVVDRKRQREADNGR